MSEFNNQPVLVFMMCIHCLWHDGKHGEPGFYQVAGTVLCEKHARAYGDR